jgi:hypothetical protein
LNPHALRHTPLKRTCLPFHHPSARVQNLESGKQESKKPDRLPKLVLVLVIEFPFL